MRCFVAVVVALYALQGSANVSTGDEITAEQVRAAIERGRDFLLSRQRINGTWPSSYISAYNGGINCLCTLALLNAGVPTSDVRMQRALAQVRSLKSQKNYVVSLQTMVLARAEPQRDRELLKRNVEWLETTQINSGPNRGAWSYPYRWSKYERHAENGAPMIGDKSNSQFALLALYEAERVGVAARESTWRTAREYWQRSQQLDGGWCYSEDLRSPASGSMTCAGIASLLIAADRAEACDARVEGDRVFSCLPRPQGKTGEIDRAFQWLGQHYSVAGNPSRVGAASPSWKLYYLYGLERAGRLTGRRFIEVPQANGAPRRVDWYREGAEHLVAIQNRATGDWTCPPNEIDPLIGTSFALLFLSKGRWPVLLGKLQCGEGDDWNRHRSDVANLTRYVEARWQRDLTWQVVDLKLAEVDELLETPVLYLCGSRNPLPSDGNEALVLARKLRDYLDRGGFLLAEANCDSTDFDAGFRLLMQQVYPEPEYALQPLDLEHPVWRMGEVIAAAQRRPLWGIEAGCRTSVIYAPREAGRPSMSCLWELSRPGRGVQFSAAVQSQVDAALLLGSHVMEFATGRQLRSKEAYFHAHTLAAPLSAPARGGLDVANLRHPGGCESAPRALANLINSAATELKLNAHVRPEPLEITDPELFNYHVVDMHGRTAFRLTFTERQRLKQFVERGGMLLADAICSSPEFSTSFRREMAAIFPERALAPIAADDSLLGTTYGGFDVASVSQIEIASADHGGAWTRNITKAPPELEGLRFDDRWGVIFSPLDLSCALESQAATPCRGYLPDDAARLGINFLLYSLQQ